MDIGRTPVTGFLRAGEGTRTLSLRFTRALLCQLSYPGGVGLNGTPPAPPHVSEPPAASA